jgi:hypothetical protein
MVRHKILYMSRPDPETLDFWRATTDSYNEYIARIAKFSRSLGNKRPLCRRPRRARGIRSLPSLQSVQKGSLGKLLVMPSPVGSDARLVDKCIHKEKTKSSKEET